MVRLTIFLRTKIVVLWEQKKSIREIARELSLSRNTVRLWIRRYEETGDVKCNHQGPRPIAYTDESERHKDIVKTFSENPFSKTRFSAQTHGISLKTVRRHLHAAGIHNYKPAKKIQLSEAHRQARLAFARKFLDFDWKNKCVIFTDEKCFRSDKDGRQILWRRPNQRYDPKNVVSNRMSGRITLGYWGWMSSMGPGELVEVGGRMNRITYLEILRDVMLPTVRVAYPDCHIYFVQDNCAVHRSRHVSDWLLSQENLTVIEWPSKSPDLNPIENLWGQMILNWDKSEVKSKENLEAEVLSSWELMRGRDACWNMVMNMKNRLQLVIDNDGHPLRY